MSSNLTLKRTLGPVALIIYGVGDILGAGIYTLTGKVAGVAGEQAWLAFAVSMVVAALTACSYAEFSGRHPHSGGAAYFVSRATRRPTAPLLIGWLVLCSGTVSMATGSRAFAGYLCELVPALHESIAITGFLALTGLVAFWGIRESATVTILCTSATVAGLFIVIVSGVAWYFGGGVPQEATSPSLEVGAGVFNWIGIASGAALAFYAFIGFEDLVNVAEEVKDSNRTLPRAILIAVGLTGAIYVAVAWVATAVLAPEALAASQAPLLDLVRVAAPAVPPMVFTVIALFAVADTALINGVMGSRLLYGLAREGLLPRPLGTLHRVRRTPHIALAIVLSGGLVLALTGTVQNLAGTTSTLLLLVFAAVHVGLLVVKRRETDYDGLQVPRAVPALGLITCLSLVAFAPGLSLGVAGAILALGLALAGSWHIWGGGRTGVN